MRPIGSRHRSDEESTVAVGLLDKMLHMGEGRQLKKLKVVADQVNSIEADFEAMSDAELRGQTADFKQRLANGDRHSLRIAMPAGAGWRARIAS